MAQGDASEPKDSTAEEGPYWSLMFEVSESDEKAVNMEQTSLAGGKWAGLVKESIIGALNTKMISAEDQIVSIYHRCLPSRMLSSCVLLASFQVLRQGPARWHALSAVHPHAGHLQPACQPTHQPRHSRLQGVRAPPPPGPHARAELDSSC